jgi:hypothetical protein
MSTGPGSPALPWQVTAARCPETVCSPAGTRQHASHAEKQERIARERDGANNRRLDRLLLEVIGITNPAQKLLLGVLALTVAALKPFWSKFSEGLADLAIELLRNKLKRDHPGLFKEEQPDRSALPKAAKEIMPKHGEGNQKSSGSRQPARHRKSRGRRH